VPRIFPGLPDLLAIRFLIHTPCNTKLPATYLPSSVEGSAHANTFIFAARQKVIPIVHVVSKDLPRNEPLDLDIRKFLKIFGESLS
jgi:hypothetical protein